MVVDDCECDNNLAGHTSSSGRKSRREKEEEEADIARVARRGRFGARLSPASFARPPFKEAEGVPINCWGDNLQGVVE